VSPLALLLNEHVGMIAITKPARTRLDDDSGSRFESREFFDAAAFVMHGSSRSVASHLSLKHHHGM
jgi:hypothetical protein